MADNDVRQRRNARRRGLYRNRYLRILKKGDVDTVNTCEEDEETLVLMNKDE